MQNELDTPIKRQKHDSIVSERNLKYNYIVGLKLKGWKRYAHRNINQKKGVVSLYMIENGLKNTENY